MTADLVVNCADGDASLGRGEGQIGDLHLLLQLIEEILDFPLLFRRGRQDQRATQKKCFHYSRGAITSSITLIDRSRAGSTTASAARHPTCSPTVVNSSISPPE